MPLAQRTIQPYPCPEHGDPRQLSDENQAWLHFYIWLVPYHRTLLSEQQKDRPIIFLDRIALLQFCQQLNISFVEAEFWLSIIHEEFYPFPP